MQKIAYILALANGTADKGGADLQQRCRHQPDTGRKPGRVYLIPGTGVDHNGETVQNLIGRFEIYGIKEH